MTQLTKYVIALSNLYGMVHKDKVLEIYNSKNKDKINLSDIEKMLSNPPKELKDAFVLIHKDYFVMECIIENDEFDLMLRNKKDKPYYIPAKNILLKYIDESYFEKSNQYNELLNYLKKNFYKNEDEHAQWIAEDIQGMCQFGVDIQTILESLTSYKINFKDIKQANELVNLIMELSNNTRIWENNGHTPHEIFEKFEKPNLKPLANTSLDIDGTNAITSKQKIGRNDPCPCSSGKKYKKCCLGKIID